MKLVIVESPAKAKTIKKYLGSDFEVIASVGHVRDLPSKQGSVIPEENFAIKYVVSEKAAKHIANITNAATKASAIYLATDPDREGESISWHIAEIIKEKIPSNNVKFQRIAFNEVTKKAVIEAINDPREIDINLVNAQQARRALDYLVGFTLSPLLWRKLPGCKSAGRVQSVALRLICDQEEKIEKFKTEEYWDIWFDFLNQNSVLFKARLSHINNEKLDKFYITNQSAAVNLVEELNRSVFRVSNLEKKQQKRQPSPPFITSSLQQEAARKLGFSAKKTMQIAQKLYEGIDIDGNMIGLITYMRTDGTTISTDIVASIRELINNIYGDKYLPSEARQYKTKAKNAQEAHEAIRPTDINLLPDTISNQLDKDYYKLYDLIWKRTVACQMENVLIDTVTATISSLDNKFTLKANGSTIVFDGFYRIYQEGKDDDFEEETKILPKLEIGEQLETKNIKPLQHFTEPPPRFSEASLVKKLEELGIGRPSTYASILSVLQERKYVNLVKKRFVPETLGRLLNTFLVGFFKKYVEYDFTASLETELDEIADGKLDWKESLNNFWQGFNHNIGEVKDQKITDIISYIEKTLTYHLFGLNEGSEHSVLLCTNCNNGKLQLKLGKFGAFLACSNYPECSFKKNITNGTETSEDTTIASSDTNQLLGVFDGLDVYLKKGPYGWYLQQGTVSAELAKPKRTPLPSGYDPKEMNIETAKKLLSLPLSIGKHPETEAEITIGIGKYGPYVKYDGKFISIPKNLSPFNITVEQAVEVIMNNKDKVSRKKKSG